MNIIIKQEPDGRWLGKTRGGSSYWGETSNHVQCWFEAKRLERKLGMVEAMKLAKWRFPIDEETKLMKQKGIDRIMGIMLVNSTKRRKALRDWDNGAFESDAIPK